MALTYLAENFRPKALMLAHTWPINGPVVCPQQVYGLEGMRAVKRLMGSVFERIMSPWPLYVELAVVD